MIDTSSPIFFLYFIKDQSKPKDKIPEKKVFGAKQAFVYILFNPRRKIKLQTIQTYFLLDSLNDFIKV